MINTDDKFWDKAIYKKFFNVNYFPEEIKSHGKIFSQSFIIKTNSFSSSIII